MFDFYGTFISFYFTYVIDQSFGGVAKRVEFNGKTKQNIDVISPDVIPSIQCLVKVMTRLVEGAKIWRGLIMPKKK